MVHDGNDDKDVRGEEDDNLSYFLLFAVCLKRKLLSRSEWVIF